MNFEETIKFSTKPRRGYSDHKSKYYNNKRKPTNNKTNQSKNTYKQQTQIKPPEIDFEEKYIKDVKTIDELIEKFYDLMFINGVMLKASRLKSLYQRWDDPNKPEFVKLLNMKLTDINSLTCDLDTKFSIKCSIIYKSRIIPPDFTFTIFNFYNFKNNVICEKGKKLKYHNSYSSETKTNTGTNLTLDFNQYFPNRPIVDETYWSLKLYTLFVPNNKFILHFDDKIFSYYVNLKTVLYELSYISNGMSLKIKNQNLDPEVRTQIKKELRHEIYELIEKSNECFKYETWTNDNEALKEMFLFNDIKGELKNTFSESNIFPKFDNKSIDFNFKNDDILSVLRSSDKNIIQTYFTNYYKITNFTLTFNFGKESKTNKLFEIQNYNYDLGLKRYLTTLNNTFMAVKEEIYHSNFKIFDKVLVDIKKCLNEINIVSKLYLIVYLDLYSFSKHIINLTFTEKILDKKRAEQYYILFFTMAENINKNEQYYDQDILTELKEKYAFDNLFKLKGVIKNIVKKLFY